MFINTIEETYTYVHHIMYTLCVLNKRNCKTTRPSCIFPVEFFFGNPSSILHLALPTRLSVFHQICYTEDWAEAKTECESERDGDGDEDEGQARLRQPIFLVPLQPWNPDVLECWIRYYFLLHHNILCWKKGTPVTTSVSRSIFESGECY